MLLSTVCAKEMCNQKSVDVESYFLLIYLFSALQILFLNPTTGENKMQLKWSIISLIKHKQ